DLRYQSCHEIVADLEEYLSQHGVRSVTAGLATKTGATAPGASPAAMQATQVLFSGATPAPSATHDAPTALVSSPEPATQPEVMFREPDTIVPRTPTLVAPVIGAPAMPLITPPVAAAQQPAYAAVPPVVAAAAQAPPRKSSRGPILFIILAVLLAGGAGLAFVGYKVYGRYQAAREQITTAFNTATSSTTTTATTTSTNASALTATPPAGVLLSNQLNPSQSAGSSDTAAAGGQAPAQVAATPSASAAGAPVPATHRPSPNEVTRGPMTRDPVAAAAAAAPQQRAADPARRLSGVAVAVTGDAALLGPVASVLTSELEGAGLQATDAATLPATEDVLRHGNASASNLIDRLRHEGHAVLVLARVDPTGQRELNYMGRSDTAYSARVTITAYDLATGRPLGSGKNATIEYTSRTADRESEKVIGPLARQVIETIPGH
ncbi:MAG: serine/threonine protein kinase, partial [Gemmatimonadetes bacterium]|nr:serine/threonine protein kinase [Gemmatimonadota bacterium]